MAVPEGHGVAPNIAAIVRAAGRATCAVELLDASRGGFARVDDELLAFMREVEAASGLPLEPVYTGKALLALAQAVAAGRFARGQRLVFVYTGGSRVGGGLGWG